MNVRNISTGNKTFGRAGRRNHAKQTYAQYVATSMVPPISEAMWNAQNKSGGSLDWNGLISSVGDSVSSVFGWLTASKQGQINAQYQQQQNRNNNSVLWIGLGVVAVVVVGLIVFLRKK